MKTTKCYFLIPLLCCMAFSINVDANETIRFGLQANQSSGYVKRFTITATADKQFTVNWGDNIETITGTGNSQTINHTYANANYYAVTITGVTSDCLFTYLSFPSLNINSCRLIYLDISGCNALEYLSCPNNQLAHLDLSKNTVLQTLICYGNQLQLSDLYAASEMISNPNNKSLGPQILLSRIVSVNSPVDYSAQKEFGGIATDFKVEKNGLPVPASDYAISDGIITFHKTGNYTVTMTNSAIVSHPSYPAQVIAEFVVATNESIRLTWQGDSAPYTYKSFGITAIAGSTFTVDWGDDFGGIVTKTGTGTLQTIYHYYYPADYYTVTISSSASSFTALNCFWNQISELDLTGCPELRSLICYGNLLTDLDLSANTKLVDLDCSDNRLTGLDLSANTALSNLNCSNNRLTSLDLSVNTALEELNCSNNRLTGLDLSANKVLRNLKCYNNRLQPADLYAASKIISNPNNKRLGRQTLVPQVVADNSIDYSRQATFGGIATDFTVEKNGLPALSGDYSVTEGVITFHKSGCYNVSMTNSAIVSYGDYPAKVNAEFVAMSGSGMTNAQTTDIGIYPNPTVDMVYIQAETIPEVKLYAIDGRLLQTIRSREINLSGYAPGVYYLQVEGKMMKVIKK